MAGKVLVVEDSQVIQKLVKQVLSLRGIDVFAAKDGQQGLDQALKTDFDLMLVDLLMPVMDGQKFLEELRKAKAKNSDTPAIIISGNESNLQVKDLKSLGVVDMLEKPIDFDKLSLLLKNFTKIS